MATERQRERFRGGTGDTSGAVWSNAEVDAKFADAAEDFPGAGNELLIAVAVRAGIEELMADSAKRTNYRAGETSEDAGDIFKHLEALHRVWNGKVDSLAGSSKPVVRWGGFRGLATSVEVPDA